MCLKIHVITILTYLSEEEISNMRLELEKYGIQMPAFSKIGGILANELSVDEAARKEKRCFVCYSGRQIIKVLALSLAQQSDRPFGRLGRYFYSFSCVFFFFLEHGDLAT